MNLPLTDATLFQELLALPGISGCEGPVRDYILSAVADAGGARVDAIGNAWLTIGGDGPRVLMAAHTDEVGLQITHIGGDGFLRFSKVGTIDDRVLLGRPVVIHTPGGTVDGVTTIPAGTAPSSARTWKELAIDIGVRSGDAVRELGIAVSAPVTFRRQFALMNGRFFSGWAIDDRWGCYAVIRMLRHAIAHPPRARVTFAWLVQEEVGLRGGQALAAQERFDVVLPIDGFTTSAVPGQKAFLAYAQLGDGPVLRVVDHGAFASRSLSRWVEGVARRRNLPLQVGVTGGETDGKPIQISGGHMLPLSVPMRYSHSAAQMLHLGDLENLVALGCGVLDDIHTFDVAAPGSRE